MVRIFCILALVLILHGHLPAESTASPLPADAQKLVDAFDAEAAKMRADTEKAIDKKAATLANQLATVQEKLTKKGDLDGALAVKQKISALNSKDASAAASSANSNVPEGNKAPTHDDTGGKYVVLYNDFNYTGTKVKIPVPTEISQVTALGFPNDALRSIQVPPGVVVKLYDGDMGGGSVTDIFDCISDLTSLTHIGTTSLSAKKK